MTIIVSNYSGYYESIHTEESLSILTIKLKYILKGYRVHNTPLWYAKLMYKYFNKRVYQGANISFERLDRTKDQVTHWSPYDNFR